MISFTPLLTQSKFPVGNVDSKDRDAHRHGLLGRGTLDALVEQWMSLWQTQGGHKINKK